ASDAARDHATAGLRSAQCGDRPADRRGELPDVERVDAESDPGIRRTGDRLVPSGCLCFRICQLRAAKWAEAGGADWRNRRRAKLSSRTVWVSPPYRARLRG